MTVAILTVSAFAGVPLLLVLWHRSRPDPVRLEADRGVREIEDYLKTKATA